MTSDPDDPEDKSPRGANPLIPSGELADALSRIRETMNPSLEMQSHLAGMAKPTQGIRAHMASIAAPSQALRDILPSIGSPLHQSSLEHILQPAKLEAFAEPFRTFAAQIEEMLAPHRAIMAQVEQLLSPIRAAQTRWEEMIAPFQTQIAALAAPFQDIAESIQRSLGSPEMQEWIKHWNHKSRVKDALDRAGWLPHPTIPDEIVLEALEDEGEEAVSEAVERYLQENWHTVAAEFRDRFKRSGADDETLASMDEALHCRANGFHRTTCRAVFPEIERVARLRMPPPDPTKMASLVEARGAIAKLPANALGLPGILWISVFEHVQEACYAKIGKDASEEDFPLPNRHAVAHGLLPYSSPRDSMNSLVIADFMLTCVGSVVAYLSPRDPLPEEGALGVLGVEGQ